MSKRLKLVTLIGVILAIVFSTTLAPVQSAYAESGNTEASLKKVLYASAVYQCAVNYGGGQGFFQQVAKGDKISSIFSNSDSYNYYIGTGYGLSASGTISCREAAEKLFSSTKIGDGSLGDNGILKGVYEYSSSGEKKINCKYGIINSQKSGLIQNNKLFYWPAGYYDGPTGHVNMTNHGKISVVYDDSGPIRLEGSTSDINVEHTLESMRGWGIDWKHDNKICTDLVRYTEVYPFETQNLQGETITVYEPIRTNTTDKIGGSWILNGGNTADAAWLNTASPAGFRHEVEAVTDSTKLLPTSDAGAKLAFNIQKKYLDGAAGLSAFLTDHPDARYLLYGRYLFNGDGGYSGGCAGAVVPDKDVDPQKMDTTYWDTSLSYVSTFTAWKNASTKETYRVKFGGNGIASAGRDVDVILPGQDYKACSALISEFSSTTNSVTTATPKTTVYKYMGVTAAEDLPDENDPNTVPGGGSGSTGNGGEDNEVSVSNCINAAGALGWIICPTLKLAGEAAEKLYGYIEDNFLWVGSDVMGDGTPTHQAWGKFRNYANVAFIIVFLVVILSQITGFGISNYGVKKILPRLIAVALLTNLSFIICQLAVDLSDIVGSGIKSALSSNSFSVTGIADSHYGVNNIISDIFGILFASAGAVGTGYLAAVTWEIWLPPLLLAVIVAIVGVIVFFLSLAVRQAGIVILVVLCPVAIICYALPNTKKLFDKWFRMFTSLLMVYPICGLLMGGGQLASSILVNLSNADDTRFMLTLTAMLLSVVPFFFIPTIVRTSLNTIGQLGARLSNFGRGFSNRVTGMVRNSERFKDWQNELKAQHDESTVRRIDNRAARRARNGKDNNGYTAGSRRRRLRAYMRADKARREELLGRAYEGRALLQDDEGRQEQLLESLNAKDFEERVASAKALYRKNPEMAQEDSITKAHDALLSQLGDNPDDIQLQSQLRALQEMDMEKGAPGQDLMQQSIARWIANNNVNNSWNDNKKKALSRFSAGLATRYGKELNSSDKGFNAALNDFAKGDFDKLGSFSKATDKKGNDIYLSDYDTKLSSFSAAGLKNATPGALQRGAEIMRNGTFKDAATERAMLGKITQAFNDKLIANDIKPAEKGIMQEILGYGAAKGDYDISKYNDVVEKNDHDIFTNMEQGTLENLAQFIDSADKDNARDLSALKQLGANIVASADNGRLYSESDTKRIQKMLGILNGKTGMTYEFNPTSMQVDKSNQGNQNSQQQDIPEWMRVSDAERAQLEADAAKSGRRIR